MNRTLTLLAFVPALALGLSACGSSTETPSAPAAASSPATATASTPAPAETASPSTSMPMPAETSATPAPTETSAAATPDAPKPADAPKAAIGISNFMFMVPASVAPGATITVTNDDSVAHTVTSDTGAFDVKVNPGATATMTAPTKPGSYPFDCAIHSSMTGTLVVK
ncbi:MAG: cupredoxin domain-containing protein [Terracoccus sp.]